MEDFSFRAKQQDQPCKELDLTIYKGKKVLLFGIQYAIYRSMFGVPIFTRSDVWEFLIKGAAAFVQVSIKSHLVARFGVWMEQFISLSVARLLLL